MSTARPCLDCRPGKVCRTHRMLELAKQRAEGQARVAREQAALAQRRRCPSCGCTGMTCVIVLADGAGEGVCSPAGELGAKECSACALKRSGTAA